MTTTPEDTTLELSTAEKLDDEIAKLRAQVDSLKRDLQVHASTLLTCEPVARAILSSPSAAAAADPLRARLAEQEAHEQQCLYRACASVTAFRVRDPDPRAVDGGRVLGVRVEVMARARFLRPYFVMLNRPWARARDHLRVHRHTVPACVPLAGLAERYLPPPPPPPSKRRAAGGGDENDGREEGEVEGEGEEDVSERNGGRNTGKDKGKGKQPQDLPRFVRALRRELVRYHNRVAAIGDLQKAAGLGGKRRKSREVMDPPIVDISAADAEAKQVRVEWGDGKSGRLVMNDDGDLLKMVVQGMNGRDRETVRQFLGGAVRVEEISKHF